MTEQTRHRLAISLMVVGIVIGFVCWWLTPPILWIVAGVAAVFLLAGIFVASKVSRDSQGPGGPWK
jgi:uncharacterized membrane protein